MDVTEKWWFDCLMRGSIDPTHIWEVPIETDRVFEALAQYSSHVGLKTR